MSISLSTDVEDETAPTSPFPPSVQNPYGESEVGERPGSAGYMSETTNTSSADVSRMDPEGGNLSFRRSHADSLTYSPYPSGYNILQDQQPQQQQQQQSQQLTADSLGPRRGLFSELNTEEASADFLDVQSVSSAGDSEPSVNHTQTNTYQHTESQEPQQAAVNNKTVSAKSLLPTSTDRGHQSSTEPVPVHTPPPVGNSSGNNPFDASPHPSSGELSHPPTHPQHHHAVSHPSRDSLPGNSTAFVDVLTPPPDYSPLPERGLGTWSAVRGTGTEGTGTQLDYDSDQSEYAI